ncbi:MAG: PLDc_N domain-containing protein [Cellulomonas sp.]|uniref:PLD nuclease N-terminal domain-containing protein n=1 Tax=Cellulomonas sp. 73-92 TaxID=1895740 RepID=UPI00092AFCDD|nr:PLD nuclease N-terminal domain-containing protein [Cellulomonas sp. 73-92]MBN9374740.1 PLDc_N domain-containing protein [Cellulomonas sp.]OJV83436.1 MAG: hypothetical protein BGO37_09195 [Cellulomonas sp. 73-92]
MWRVLPFFVEIGLLVYCLIDCLQSDEGRIRNLSKTGWIILIVLLPLAGGVAWLVAGRPVTTGPRRVPWPSTQTAGFPEYERPRPLGPDDDPTFLASRQRSDERHEQMLRDWEQQLRERERRLREQEGNASDERGDADR